MDTQLTQEEMQAVMFKAAAKGDCMTLRLLVINGVDVEAKNDDGFTAFNVAIQNDKVDAATVLLAAREMKFAEDLGVDPKEFYKIKEKKKQALGFLKKKKG